MESYREAAVREYISKVASLDFSDLSIFQDWSQSILAVNLERAMAEWTEEMSGNAISPTLRMFVRSPRVFSRYRRCLRLFELINIEMGIGQDLFEIIETLKLFAQKLPSD